MNSASKEAARRQREREHEALMQAAAREVGALAKLVSGREARTQGDGPLEVAFAAARGDAASEPALSAGVWVALRRGDVEAALEALIAVSSERFVLGTREELGDGYRLRTVEEVRMLPDLAALRAQLAAMLGIPVDVVAILGEWGPDDPRTTTEIDLLLDSRFGGARRRGAAAARPTEDGPDGPDPVTTPPPPRPSFPAPRAWPAGGTDGSPRPDAFDDHAASREATRADRAPLSMSVAELADVLQLSAAQGRVLSTLVRHARLTVVGSGE